MKQYIYRRVPYSLRHSRKAQRNAPQVGIFMARNRLRGRFKSTESHFAALPSCPCLEITG
jgi:hypothetical protein